MPVPDRPMIYHIVHVDRLPSIVADGHLWCDSIVAQRGAPGTTIGMNNIKERRLNELTLSSHPELHVGDCIPFYFCPRSVMLYMIYKGNHPELNYRGGQGPIVHLEADLRKSVAWAEQHALRWSFTTSNAGSYYFVDYANLADLERLDWDAIQAHYWSACKESKQAEFLIERLFPWELIGRIGVKAQNVRSQVQLAMKLSDHRPRVEIMPRWYY